MKSFSYLCFMAMCICVSYGAQAQSNYYDVTVGNGYGYRFWQSDAYKIHMGNSAEYLYGPVSDYSIKTNMSGGPNRGWTWGAAGSTPVAAINTSGQMQIAGSLMANGDIHLPQSGTYQDGWGQWIRIGSSSYSAFPFNAGSSAKNGIATAWDSDGLFVGLSDEGSNRKDAVIAWGDDVQDNLRFLFNNTELMRLNPNGIVGIGLTTPSVQTKLHVYEPGSSSSTWRGRIVSSGASSAVVMGEWNGKACIGGHNSTLNGWSDLFLQFDGGNVGIGTQAATQKLEITGGVLQNAENVGWGIDLGTTARLGFIKKAGFGPMIASDVSSPIIFAQTNQVGIHTNISGATLTERMRIDANGNVGIGTNTPGSFKLAVNGKIWTQEVNVQMTNPGPDYVFEKDYNLLPLSELANYIKQNKHLPEVPSAKEMEKDGLNLKDMNLLLLKKVEELTLHVIELKEENSMLKQETAEIHQLKRDIETLKKNLK